MDGARDDQAELVVVRYLRARPGGEDGLLEYRQVGEAAHQRRVGVELGPDGRQGGVDEDTALAGHAGEELDESERGDLMARERADREVGTAERARSWSVRPRQRGHAELARHLVAWPRDAGLPVDVGPVVQEEQFPCLEGLLGSGLV